MWHYPGMCCNGNASGCFFNANHYWLSNELHAGSVNLYNFQTKSAPIGVLFNILSIRWPHLELN